MEPALSSERSILYKLVAIHRIIYGKNALDNPITTPNSENNSLIGVFMIPREVRSVLIVPLGRSKIYQPMLLTTMLTSNGETTINVK
jgi:hypothetical protein